MVVAHTMAASAGDVTSAVTGASPSSYTLLQAPDFGAHTRTLPSSPPVTSSLPSRVKSPHVTGPACPAKTCMHTAAPAAGVDHIQAVPSEEPASSTSPLGCHTRN